MSRPTVKRLTLKTNLFLCILAVLAPHAAHAGFAMDENDLTIRGRRWPDRVVPYEISGRFSAEQRQRILDVIQFYNDRTIVKWVPRRSEEDYVQFDLQAWGARPGSSQGRVLGPQKVLIGATENRDVIAHEMGHTVGLLHEETRPDTANYLKFTGDMSNERDARCHKIFFEGAGSGITTYTPYDFYSVMHSNSGDCTVPPVAVIVPRQPRPALPPSWDWNTHFLSPQDIETINRLYQAPARPFPPEASESCRDSGQVDCSLYVAEERCHNYHHARFAYEDCAATCGLCKVSRQAQPSPVARLLLHCNALSEELLSVAGNGCHPMPGNRGTYISFVRLDPGSRATLYPTGDCSGTGFDIQRDTDLCGLRYPNQFHVNDNVGSIRLSAPGSSEAPAQRASNVTSAATASLLVNEPFDDLGAWSTTGEPVILPAGQLLVRPSSSIASVYRANLAVPASYKLIVIAKVDAYAPGAENMGFKVSDGARRLMFQRRSDGFYAITSTSGGAWQKVWNTSHYTGWGEYQITVTDGAVSLRTRRWPNGTFDGPIRWDLPAHNAADRVEVWVKGTSADLHVDHLTLESLGRTSGLAEPAGWQGGRT